MGAGGLLGLWGQAQAPPASVNLTREGPLRASPPPPGTAFDAAAAPGAPCCLVVSQLGARPLWATPVACLRATREPGSSRRDGWGSADTGWDWSWAGLDVWRGRDANWAPRWQVEGLLRAPGISLLPKPGTVRHLGCGDPAGRGDATCTGRSHPGPTLRVWEP